jgi:hypothetical protein
MPPESFDADLMDDWSVWALDNGLPPLPPTVTTGESVPVARWAGPRFGAVLHVAWSTGVDDEDDALISEVQVFRRTGSKWQPSTGSGGTGWFDPPFVRPAEVTSARVAVGHLHASGSDDWRCCAVDGLVGTVSRRVRSSRPSVPSSFVRTPTVSHESGSWIVINVCCWSSHSASNRLTGK